MTTQRLWTTRLALLLCTSFFIQSTFAQKATLDGTVIKMPVVVVGAQQFSVDLSLDAGSNPPTFSLAAFSETSGGDTTSAPFLEGTTLKIPTIDINGVDFFVDLALLSDNPVSFQLANFAPNPTTTTPPTSEQLLAQATTLFQETVEQPVINNRCINCHVQGGAASFTALVYERQSSTSTANNIQEISNYIQARQNGVQTILNKTQGIGHGGGPQLQSSSAEFAALSAFLTALTAALSAG
ncbi:MAG: hypothetical protein AB8B95_05370 [Pseudohongiellaceae bacterium]